MDNLKSAVIKACFYDPAINRTYGDMAAHYDTALDHCPRTNGGQRLASRAASQTKGQSKGRRCGLARRALDVARDARHLYLRRTFGATARLRNQRFFGLGELNAAIRPLRDQLNNKVTRHLGASRRALFETLDKPALKPLPAEPYVYAEWKKCRASLDYHVDIGRHYYSVPHQLLRQELWARITARTVEIYHKGQRVAAHQRTSGNRKHSTIP